MRLQYSSRGRLWVLDQSAVTFHSTRPLECSSLQYTNGIYNLGLVAQTPCWTARVRSRVSEWWRFFFTPSCPDHGRLARWRKWRAYDVREAKEGLDNLLQPFRHFTYVTAHSPTLPSLYLRRSSFSNRSVASPTSQLILRSFSPDDVSEDPVT